MQAHLRGLEIERLLFNLLTMNRNRHENIFFSYFSQKEDNISFKFIPKNITYFHLMILPTE